MSDFKVNEMCPLCASWDTWREEVDIGVGIQCGPLRCNRCSYREENEIDALLRTLDDEQS